MKIGIFDSGLGGLLLTRAIVDKLPEYDFVYLGDTQRVPYGNRSHDVVYKFLLEAVEYLFEHDCRLIIVACNTASALGVAQIQQEYLPIHHPDKKVLGVIVPTVEEIIDKKSQRVGILATQGTVESESYLKYIKKEDASIQVFQQSAPLLVPLIEHDGGEFLDPILNSYLKPLMAEEIDTLVLGCTHYPMVKKQISRFAGERVRIISQDEIIPAKLKNYLERHQEISSQLSRSGTVDLLVTDNSPYMQKLAHNWFGKDVRLRLVKI